MAWMGPLGYTCAAALATVLTWSAVGKLIAHRTTVSRLAEGRVHVPALVSFAAPALELALAALLLARPADGGAAALVALAAFHFVLAWDLGVSAGSVWFGSARPGPVSGVAVARTAGLGVLAAGSLGAGPGARMPGLADVMLVTTSVLVGMVALSAVDLRRRLAAASAEVVR